MTALTHPRLPPRRAARAGTWWSNACLRAVQEAAYSATDLQAGRSLARTGAVGAITVATGSVTAAVSQGGATVTVTGTVPVLDAASLDTLVELVAAEPGRLQALEAGQLPHPFVEAVEEAGVELLPYGAELGSACTCTGWPDPCRHALALFTQLAWLIRDDPFVLVAVRGLSRESLLRRLHAMRGRRPATEEDQGQTERWGEDPDESPAVDLADDLAVAEEAAARAALLLRELDPPADAATGPAGSTGPAGPAGAPGPQRRGRW